MSIRELCGQPIEVNDEGFLLNPDHWTESIAEQLAAENGVPFPLTERHWVVLHFMRQQYFENGDCPTVRKLSKTSGVSIKELYTLFPKGPAKIAAKCAGVPKPRGCV